MDQSYNAGIEIYLIAIIKCEKETEEQYVSMNTFMEKHF